MTARPEMFSRRHASEAQHLVATHNDHDDSVDVFVVVHHIQVIALHRGGCCSRGESAGGSGGQDAEDKNLTGFVKQYRMITRVRIEK